MEHAAKAVVIGGGVLGLEAAWELKKAGIDVQVLEAAPILMGRQLDENASDILRMFAEKERCEDQYGRFRGSSGRRRTCIGSPLV